MSCCATISLKSELAFAAAFLLFLGLAAPSSFAQQAPVPEVSFPVVVSTDGADWDWLGFDYDPAAEDDGTESQFLEEEQPPLSAKWRFRRAAGRR